MGSTSSAAFLRSEREVVIRPTPLAHFLAMGGPSPAPLVVPPSLLGRGSLLQVPELQRAILRGGEQRRLAVVESQGADAVVV